MEQVQIDLGHKRTCPHCGAKYYDFYQEELDCPQCGKSIEAINITKPKKKKMLRVKHQSTQKKPQKLLKHQPLNN